MVIRRRRVFDVAAATLVLAVLSLLFNYSLGPEMAGEWQTYSFVRKTITKVLNSGTAWAALAVYAGWRVARPVAAAVAGIVACEAALFVHYVLGWAVGMYGGDIFSSNVYWFVGAAVVCGPLGLIGWVASRRGWAALLARLVVPAGALLEPLVLGQLVQPFPQIPWPERWSATASGVILLALGALGVVLVLRSGWRRQSTSAGQ